MLREAGKRFRDYLDFVGFEPSNGEEKLHIDFSLSHIVNRLFLWNTFHSGGTSTAAKCRELGADPCDKKEVSDALKSMMLGHFEDRWRYEAALSAITEPDKREKFIADWQDGCSSLNDIGSYCHKLAEKLK